MRRLLLPFFLFSNFSFVEASSSSFTPFRIYSHQKSADKAQESNQRDLYDATRKGVVTISVTAHVILNKLINDKSWSGTGFITDLKLGFIVTNAHIAGEFAVCTYEVKFGNGKTAEARLAYIDPCYDFAILVVEPKDIPEYCIALKCSSEPVTVNTTVYSMGNSASNEFSIYTGAIFDVSSILWIKTLPEQSFQFSGLTVPGASGSPVLNDSGEVIGLLYGGKFVSGAALPISYVTPVVACLASGKTFKRYFCGCIFDYASLQDVVASGAVPEKVAKEYENAFPSANNKILVVSRKLTSYGSESSPARAGDVILSVNGKSIGPELKDIDKIIHESSGKAIEITAYRNGDKIEYTLPVYELSVNSKLKLFSFAGTTFFEPTDDLKINTGKATNGVYFADSELGSPFNAILSSSNNKSAQGIAQITSIDGQKISSIDDFISVVPSLLKKKVFTICYIRVGGDLQESSMIVKHNPEFADAVLHVFDQKERRWKVKDVK
ncbi:MAG: S1C family serine protease [Holosporales bacterium]|jgi:S1-C subfamily serine protease|nr:S1C family serine protease [Holosporales bacterium]